MKSRHALYCTVVFITLLLVSCGENLFSTFASSKMPEDPYLALERAEYLYLSGDVAKADDFYTRLIDQYEDDPSNRHIYYESLRGHAKCIIEKDSDDSKEVLDDFLNFAFSIDPESFETDNQQMEDFKKSAEAYTDVLNESFDTLALIPHDHRTEGDYANMSIAGVFTILFQASAFFGEAAQSQSTVMEKIESINEKQEEFNAKWEEYENDPTNTQLRDELKALAEEIDTIYTEIDDTLDDTVTTMEEVEEDSARIKAETEPAENSISVQLSGLFNPINEAVSGALPAIKEIESQSGDFYDHWQEALNF